MKQKDYQLIAKILGLNKIPDYQISIYESLNQGNKLTVDQAPRRACWNIKYRYLAAIDSRGITEIEHAIGRHKPFVWNIGFGLRFRIAWTSKTHSPISFFWRRLFWRLWIIW